MFDAVVGDLSERYGLGDRSRELFGLLLGYIFNDRRGGFGGFVESFREQGHGELVASWFGNPASPRPLNAGDVGTVFGQGLLNDWSSRLGTSRATLAAAIAGVLPRLVAELTPNGRLPASSGVASPGERQPASEEWDRPVAAPSRSEPPILPPEPHRPAQPSADPAAAVENRADAMLAAFAAPADPAPNMTFEPHVRKPPAPHKREKSRGWLLWLVVLAALIAGGVWYAWSLGLLNPYLEQLGLQ